MSYKNDISGVYCLKSIEKNLIYIGSSQKIKRRFALHKSAIKREDNKRSVAAFYGCNIVLEILEQTDNLLEREQYWIDFYRNQNIWKLVNIFDANREKTSISDNFRNKMSKIVKERWKNQQYREEQIKKSSKTFFTPERLNKKIHIYLENGNYIGYFPSAKIASEILNISKGVCYAARGKYRNKFYIQGYIAIYDELRVLYKLDELLEAHQELRVISSQAWEVSFEYHEGSTTNQ